MFSKIIRSLNVVLLFALLLNISTAAYAQPKAAFVSTSHPIALSAAPGRPVAQSELRQSMESMDKKKNPTNTAVNYYNWSGYADTSSTPFVAAESTFTQPVVTCPVAGATTLFWVGFDGYTNNTVEQAGTGAQCNTNGNPNPVYYAWWEMYPTNNIQVMPITINAGDTIDADVTYNASNASYALSVSDKKDKQQYTQQTTCESGLTCARQSAEWIVERPTLNNDIYSPLANWGSMNLNDNKAATVASTNRGIVNPTYHPINYYYNTPIDMVNESYPSTTLATVGPLNISGAEFNDTWKAAQ